MCECGCGDGEPIFQFPGPNKSVYVARVYPGCVNCEAPVGVLLTKYNSKKELEEWGLQDLKNGKFDNNLNEEAIPVIKPEFVVDEFVKLCGDAVIETDGFDEDDPFTVRELLTDTEREATLQLITNACFSTLNEARKEIVEE